MPTTANGKPWHQLDLLEVELTGPATKAVQTALTSGLNRLLKFDPNARLGTASAIHGMRTSTRRLRSTLRSFSRLIKPEWARPVEGELKWLAQVLGTVRDLDVLHARFSEAAPHARKRLAPLFQAIEMEREQAQENLNETLAGDRYQRLIDRLKFAAEFPAMREDAKIRRKSDLARLMLKPWKSLKKAGRALELNDHAEAFHEVRKRAKRVRYTAEDLAEVLGGWRVKEAGRFAKEATRIQRTLGEHQDAIIAARMLSGAVVNSPHLSSFVAAAQKLQLEQHRHADKARKHYFKVWNKFDRKSLRRWIKD